MEHHGFDHDRLKQMDEVLAAHAERDDVPGLVWLAARHGEVHVGWAGVQDHGGTAPVQRDSLFRIASMSKPVVAAALMTFVDECAVRLDDPVDELLPELANPRVLVDPAGPIDRTVPAERPITVRDVLTFRLGYGMDFGSFSTGGRQTQLDAQTERGLSSGPPNPQALPTTDAWIAALGAIPLEHQPGARWLYNTGSDVAGVLVERLGGRPLEAVLRERLLDPLGMVDTAFSVPADQLHRFGACHFRGDDGPHQVYDARDGQWSSPPPFPSGAGGLVSTVDDYLAFAEMLLAGGTGRNGRVLSRAAVELMTSDHLTAEQRAGGPSPDGTQGWGFGVGVVTRRTQLHGNPGTYGWTGGLGSSWGNDPTEALVGILLTNEMFSSPALPAEHQDFWTCAAAAMR